MATTKNPKEVRTNITANSPKPDVPVPGLPEIRSGDQRWEGMIANWEQEHRPHQVQLGSVTYLALQDSQTGYFFFRPIGAEGAYGTRSL